MDTRYSRNNPSPRYRELLDLYRKMHQEGEQFSGLPAEKTFTGHSLVPQARRILELIDMTGARTILDYGCGKGEQYKASPVVIPGEGEYHSVQDYWVVDSIHCYDPNYLPFSTLPTGTFDGVVSTDVLEHCPEPDLPWILDEIFGFARLFVFANVACYPAKKRLANGENAHCTIRPPEWWTRLIGEVAANHPQVKWKFVVQFQQDGVLHETPITNY